MTEQEVFLRVSDIVDHWMGLNLRVIQATFEEQRQVLVALYERSGQPVPFYLLPEKCALSEQPVCRVSEWFALPHDFVPVHKARVTYWQEKRTPNNDNHVFFFHRPGDLVFDLTAAQFIAPNDATLGPGERIVLLHGTMPSYVTVYAGGIASLLAPREELANLGIIYDF